MIEKYWGAERVYHHTAPITMNYALYEALRIVVEEGLEARFRRHRENAAALQAGLSALGLEPAAQEGYRLPQLAVVKVPAGDRRRQSARRIVAQLQRRDRGRAGSVQGQGLAYRHARRVVAARTRHAGAGRAWRRFFRRWASSLRAARRSHAAERAYRQCGGIVDEERKIFSFFRKLKPTRVCILTHLADSLARLASSPSAGFRLPIGKRWTGVCARDAR